MNKSMEIKFAKNIVQISSLLNIKRSDTKNPIEVTLKNSESKPIDLTGAVVDFIMVKYKSTLINRRAEITDAAKGLVTFFFNDGETSQLGKMKAEFKVTYPDNKIETFPSVGYIEINIEENLQGVPSEKLKGIISLDGGTF